MVGSLMIFNNILGVITGLIMGLTELLRLKISGNDKAALIAFKLVATTAQAKMLVG